MPTLGTGYGSDFPVPDLLQQDLGGTLTCPVYRDGEAQDVSAGTVTVYKPKSAAVLKTGAADVTTLTLPKFAVTDLELEATQLSMDYRVVWRLTIAGEVHTFRNRLGVVRFAPHPPCSVKDLLGRVTNLNDYLSGTGETSWQPWGDTAWREVQRWLIKKGVYPHKVVYPDELFDLFLVWWLVRIFDDLARDADPMGQIVAARDDFRAELKEIKNTSHFNYDDDDGGAADSDRPALGATFLGVSGIGETGGGFGFDPDPWGYP